MVGLPFAMRIMRHHRRASCKTSLRKGGLLRDEVPLEVRGWTHGPSGLWVGGRHTCMAKQGSFRVLAARVSGTGSSRRLSAQNFRLISFLTRNEYRARVITRRARIA